MFTLTRIHSASLLIALFLLCATVPKAQEQSQYDKGTPPQFTAGVSQLGSYTSMELGTINLSNGALNISLPLGIIGGRGFSLPLTLNYSSKIWSANKDVDFDLNEQQYTVAYADYANIDENAGFFDRIGAGWTIGAVPTLSSKIVYINRLTSGPWINCPTHAVAKLTLMMPDKGEIEFRDDNYDGAPLAYNCSNGTTASRGRRWHATDGSGMIYISDIENAAGVEHGILTGVVITSDGTRYHFAGNVCDSITDRNGNKITISHESTPNAQVQFTDQLGRVTTIQQNVPDPENSSVTLAVLVTFPGFGGERYVKIKRGVMNQNYRSDDNPALPVITGNYDPLSLGYGQWWGSPTKLFLLSYGLYAQRIDNRAVLTELVLPDDRSVRFRYNRFGEVAEVEMPTGGKVWYDYNAVFSLPSGTSPSWQTSADLHTSVWIDRVLKKRRTYADGTTLEGTWNYSYTSQSTSVNATSSSGTLLLDERHFFLPSGVYYDHPGGSGAHDGTYYTLWSTGVESRTEVRDAVGAIMEAKEGDWTQRAPVVWSTYPQQQPANDNRVNQTRKILDTGATAKVETLFDLYNNPTEVKEYDFDQTLKRRTVTSYSSTNLVNGVNYADDSIRLLRLLSQWAVADNGGSGAQLKRGAAGEWSDRECLVRLWRAGACSFHQW